MDIKELEAQFKRIDKRSESALVEVDLAGSPATSAKLNISVNESKSFSAGGSKNIPGSAGLAEEESGLNQSETLLNVNLDNVAVPDDYIQAKIHTAFSKQNTLGELPGVKVSQIGASADYEVVEDYTYLSKAGGYSITALKGFIYDRASIPRIFWLIIDKDDLSNVPPLFHDLLYRHGGVLPANQVLPTRTFLRKDVDDLFLELMRKSGVKSWRCQLAYQAVRNFSGFAWKT
ncbi:MAG TPA: DUF1353 domain-containing protein [Pyrinomonadaceae bacterium]|jgi:hypothetical protein